MLAPGRSRESVGLDVLRTCALAVALLAATAQSLESKLAVEVATSIFQRKGLGHVVAVLCDYGDALLWERTLGDEGSTLVATPKGGSAVRSLLDAKTSVGVFLHVGCSDSLVVLRQSSEAGLLGGSAHWVLAGNTTTSRFELERVAERLDLGPHSEVSLAVMAADKRTVHVVDAYRAWPGTGGTGRPLLTQLAGTWTRPAGFSSFMSGSTAVRRRNLRGAVLKAGVMVTGFRESELARVLGKPKDNNPLVSPVAAFSYVLVRHLQDLLNVTLKLQAGSFYGLLHRLSTNDLQLIATVTTMQAKYWDVVDYTVLPLWNERRVMILKNPSALWSYDAWLRPLDTKVWLILMALILGTAVVLRATAYWEVRFDPTHNQDEDSWASAITTALSMVCAQGFTTTTSWTSSRALLLMFEFFSLFINLFYTSGIVTFLLTFPPPFAQTIREMLYSPFAVGVDQDVFSRSNFTESSDPLIRDLYHNKIDGPEGGGFGSLQTLGSAARSERLAVLGSPLPLYEMLGATWSQSDICRIQEIPLLPPELLAIATAKRSPFREILNLGIVMIAERGQLARERIQWSVLRPRCALSDVTELDNVGMRQVAPLLCFVIAGVVLGASIYAIERMYTKSKSKWDASLATRTDMVIDLLKDVASLNKDSRKKVA